MRSRTRAEGARASRRSRGAAQRVIGACWIRAAAVNQVRAVERPELVESTGVDEVLAKEVLLARVERVHRGVKAFAERRRRSTSFMFCELGIVARRAPATSASSTSDSGLPRRASSSRRASVARSSTRRDRRAPVLGDARRRAALAREGSSRSDCITSATSAGASRSFASAPPSRRVRASNVARAS